jgi:hypothetical protein
MHTRSRKDMCMSPTDLIRSNYCCVSPFSPEYDLPIQFIPVSHFLRLCSTSLASDRVGSYLGRLWGLFLLYYIWLKIAHIDRLNNHRFVLRSSEWGAVVVFPSDADIWTRVFSVYTSLSIISEGMGLNWGRCGNPGMWSRTPLLACSVQIK